MPSRTDVPTELRAERKRRREQKVSGKNISRDIKVATMAALNLAGGIKYFYWLSQHKHALFVELVKKCMGNDDGDTDTNITFIVQTIAMEARPVPGVINSPIAGHISTQPRLEQTGEVIDAEAVSRG